MALVSLLLAVGCSSGADVTAGESDNGGNIQLNSGDTFDIVIGDDYATSPVVHVGGDIPSCPG